MKFYTCLLMLVLVLAMLGSCEAVWNNRRSKDRFKVIKKFRYGKKGGKKIIKKVIQMVKDKGGCNPNVCFAIDSSKSIKAADFKLQKDFVVLVAGIIAGDEEAEFAATQYSIINDPIHDLDNDAPQFQLDVDEAEQSVNKKTFISAGLGWCIREMSGLNGQPNKIVVLGDGRHNFGDKSGILSPQSLAASWRAQDPGNKVCAVGVGFRQNENRLLNIVGGDPGLVFEASEWLELIDVVEDLVLQICGFSDF